MPSKVITRTLLEFLNIVLEELTQEQIIKGENNKKRNKE
ncbi:hypothetical protein TPHV1_210004 [Treponema phagedenis]|uniref:Uncharacterized protein n=1 Tax=Treponema phagedenis TaxID=162 RepID=A0A0B7GYM2_TREPH|nr:hypothetical protein TPHV1_210004 [Treponema phagedenis]